MYNPDTHSVRSGNMFTLTLATPVAIPSETGDYEKLINKPMINSKELSGSMSLEDLGIQPAGDYASEPLSPEDVDQIIDSLA